MSDRVRESLKEILDEDLDLSLDGVTEESSLIDDLGMDSVAFAIGVVAIEEKLGVKLAEREIYDAKTVGDLEEAIRAKLGVTQ
ncbi:acyl carrier protein [Gordonia sp. HY285]|uniref:Acyl carrier protein n=1 Tax=Gordonia liuliyuniae TaxID=2911517 RepID=A0ABS9IMW9_9ACTN|nr:acyl carrier protein [Gordonia liuliyuniae]MCF8586898.1 acyl carrier protein [Gordonia liuliyuniae]MCF8609745.1 acyl carrier protein [Gordonia liuliyuniae]